MEALPDVTRHFHPVLPSRRLGKRPVQVVLAGRKYALFRDAAGRAAALADRCPHRFAPLSAGRVRPDGRLACPYHGWHFDAEGRGESPTRTTLGRCEAPSFQVVERLGYVWMASRQTPASAFPQVEWDGYRLAGTNATLFQAPLHVSLDNFSEDEHTPFVHTRLGWDEDHLDQVEFESTAFEDRTEVKYRAVQRWTVLGVTFGLRPGDFFHNEWVTRFDPVRTEYNIHWTDPRSGSRRPAELKAVIFMVPRDERSTWFHTFVLTRTSSPVLRALEPLLRPAMTWLVASEIRDDQKFIPLVADTPLELKGMKLGKFDKPLVQNRKLLQALYWGEAAASARTQAG